MSDPVTTSIQIGISAMKAGAAIATWWEVRQARRGGEGGGGTGAVVHLDDILFILANLGQRLLALDIIEYDVLPQAHAAVISAMEIADRRLGSSVQETESILQYLIRVPSYFAKLPPNACILLIRLWGNERSNMGKP